MNRSPCISPIIAGTGIHGKNKETATSVRRSTAKASIIINMTAVTNSLDDAISTGYTANHILSFHLNYSSPILDTSASQVKPRIALGNNPGRRFFYEY
jgi:hypothetical protein